jgi:hypothetical protein
MTDRRLHPLFPAPCGNKDHDRRERLGDWTLVPAMSADASRPSQSNAVNDSDDVFDSDALARELMMPTGEPVAAVIGACLLVGFVFFAGAFGHFAGGSHATHGTVSERHALQSSGGATPAPIDATPG